MDRDELMEKATAFYATHVCDEYGWQSVQMWMADFALGQYEAGQRAERERIADDIIQLHQNAKNTELFLRELSYFVHELKGGNATAHAMFDEMQEALGK